MTLATRKAAAVLFLDTDLSPYLSGQQIAAVKQFMKGEEGEYFVDIVEQIKRNIAAAPKTYEQDGKGDEAVVHFHYFRGGFDWYITELDIEDGVSQAFGLVKMHEVELGYISITELVDAGVEMDFHWTKKTLREVRAKLKA